MVILDIIKRRMEIQWKTKSDQHEQLEEQLKTKDHHENDHHVIPSGYSM